MLIKIIKMGLNNIVEDRIGLGKFQIRIFLVLCLIDMNDGVELVLSSFLNPIIREVFPDSTSTFISVVTSVFYVGILFGSIVSGQLADKHGRRVVIRFGSVMQIVMSLLFYFANSLELMVLFRLLYGFSYGFTVAITTSLFA
jgi:putative MFS transporter